MNNFDELKKVLSEKDSDETVAEDGSSANFIIFKKLNKNLCKGI